MKNSTLMTSLALTAGALLPLSCDSGSEEGSEPSGAAGSAGAGKGGSSSAGSSPVASGGSSKGGSSASTSKGGSTSLGDGGTESNGSGGDSSVAAGGSSGDPCADPGLQWGTANKTNFESYPDPGSEECIAYNGCTWAGQFAFCDDTMPEEWVAAHNIVAVFPADGLELHKLCLRHGSDTIVVTVLDTCGDDDCDGCCTENRGDADRLIDLEKYTNERWGVDDGSIEWADLGEDPGACQ